jgi:Tfp pilus assembly protein PilF
VGQDGEHISSHIQMRALLFAIAVSFLFSCTVPHVYVIDDPLTAVQHNELGYIYESQGKYELAEREYRQALNKEKNWAVPYFNLGNVHFRRGDLNRAEGYYRKALQRDPKNSDIMNNLAYVLCEQGQYDKAEKWIDRALAISTREEYLDTQKRILSRKPPSSPRP